MRWISAHNSSSTGTQLAHRTWDISTGVCLVSDDVNTPSNTVASRHVGAPGGGPGSSGLTQKFSVSILRARPREDDRQKPSGTRSATL